MQHPVHQMLHQPNIRRLVMIPRHPIRARNAPMRIPRHRPGHVHQQHRLEVIRPAQQPVRELVQRLRPRRVDDVLHLVRVAVRLDLPVALEDVAGALVGGEALRVEVHGEGVARVAALDDGIAVAHDVERAQGRVRGAVGGAAVVEVVVLFVHLSQQTRKS